jgi:prepilin-type N-terminal cleavage/methylation domain-containing protein
MSKLLRKSWKSEKGFTLIELLIVVAILGILAAVAIPNLGRFVGSSKVAAANTELGMVQTAVAAGMAENGVAVIPADAVPLSSGHDLVIIGGNVTSSYIQGGKEVLVGTYTFSTAGVVTAATYPGGPLFQAGPPPKFVAP